MGKVGAEWPVLRSELRYRPLVSSSEHHWSGRGATVVESHWASDLRFRACWLGPPSARSCPARSTSVYWQVTITRSIEPLRASHGCLRGGSLAMFGRF